MEKSIIKNRKLSILIFGMFLVILSLEIFDLTIFNNQLANDMTVSSISRFLGGIIFIIVMSYYGYKKLYMWNKPLGRTLLVIIPGVIIALNNFPISAYLNSRTTLIEPEYTIYLFLIDSLSTGFFEEIVFRSMILIVLLQALPKTKKGMLYAVVLSSAIFGLVHLLNLFVGASLGNTLLQIGYSFLMGMMWAVVFLKTKNIWLSMLLHALYNFFGQVMFALGSVSNRYDTVTLITTSVLAVIAIIYYLVIFRKIKNDDIEELINIS
ncbi:CAAX amino terminal protease self- immunity [Candidatus Izimaplasma bacterium HR1]|jgi:membrane protease YdiL (CAAX protease family)|uniref:CPBP family intramembrane glutamic endopeptidase n=1 Tax=Candidatus Izimoplasma sp. HR1 TaxID=1541959 RepID=UPI0004F5B6EA|nr:CAAX amino terminal protease self- immunity [Candidatus Izimaplasma bacterium HR1]